MELRLVSDDDRRSLYEMGNGGTWKVCKYLEFKTDSIVGNHLHKKKDELFLLVLGQGEFKVGEETFVRNAPFSFLVSRGTYHSFKLTAGSRLICLASELHDPNDDHR